MSCLKFGVFSIHRAIFHAFSLFFFIFSARRTFELQVHEMMNLSDSINDIYASEGISTPYLGIDVETRPYRARDMATKLCKI
jgi:hypothetical protein